jgi:hypothetical protein
MLWTPSDPDRGQDASAVTVVTAGLAAVLAMGCAQGLAIHWRGQTPGLPIAALGLPRQLAESPPLFDPERCAPACPQRYQSFRVRSQPVAAQLRLAVVERRNR